VAQREGDFKGGCEGDEDDDDDDDDDRGDASKGGDSEGGDREGGDREGGEMGDEKGGGSPPAAAPVSARLLWGRMRSAPPCLSVRASSRLLSQSSIWMNKRPSSIHALW